KTAVPGLPFVERRAADAVLAAHVGRLCPGLLLPQYPDDLLFREPARLHVHPSQVMDSTHFWRRSRGSGHGKTIENRTQPETCAQSGVKSDHCSRCPDKEITLSLSVISVGLNEMFFVADNLSFAIHSR